MKTIFEDSEKCLSEDDKHLSEDKNCLDQDINTDPPRPMTRALQKIIHFKKAAAVAVSLIQYELEPECDVNMFAEKYDKYPCPNCYKDVKKFCSFFRPNKFIFEGAHEHQSLLSFSAVNIPN